jgi:hypothetical protein
MTIKITPLMTLCSLMMDASMGRPFEVTHEQMDLAYEELKTGTVSKETDAVPKTLLGNDWNVRDAGGVCPGCNECDCDTEGEDETDDEDELDIDQDVAIALENAYDEAETSQELISALAGALQIAAKQLGWAHTSNAAHHIWFEA